MPISDEIIELEPVKKSKSKFIVLIAVAGVMFALAVTFLILFLVKPSAGGGGVSGKVNEVTVNSSALFTSGSDSKLYASVGTEYTIYANASVEGDKSADISWEFTPYNAFAEENLDVGKDDNGPYCRFRPSSAIADGNTLVTITAKSASDPSVNKQVQFYVVKQGTEHIKFLRYTRGANSSASNATTIAGDEITVPHYSMPQNKHEKFYVTLEQLGAYNHDTEIYSPLSLEGGNCEFTVESSDPSVIAVSASDFVQMTADQSPRFAFSVSKMSTEPVTITVRANSAVARLKVNVKSSAELGYIENIYVVDQPIGTGDEAKAFFDKLVAEGDSADWHKLDVGVQWLSDTSKNSVLTLPYMANYNNILSHVVLSPLSLQYNATTKEILTDWRSMINVSIDSKSTAKDAAIIQKPGNTVTINCQGALTNNNECLLAFTDSSRNSIASSAATVRLNIVARNSGGTASVALGGGSYSDEAIGKLISDEQGIPISTGNQATLTVTYPFLAPAATHADRMVSSGYVSTGFRIHVDYLGSETGNTTGLSVMVGNTPINKPNDIYNFSTSLAITHDSERSQNFTGKASVIISVSPGALQGRYLLTFEKIGTSINGASFNQSNQNWEIEVPFEVTPLATSAEFITAEEGKVLLTNKKGMFVPPENYGSGAIKSGTAELYVQNRSSTEPISWKVTDFIRVNGAADYTVKSNSLIPAESSRLLNNSLTADNKLHFYGRRLAINANARELEIDIDVKPQGDDKTILAQFVIYVHVVDSVTSLSCSSTVETKNYSGSSFETIQKEESVSATYTYSESQREYLTSNFELGYAPNITNSNSFEAFEKVEGTDGYKLKDRPDDEILFEYNSNAFEQKVDLFEYSIKVNKNLSHIKVRYYLNDTDSDYGFYSQDGIYAEKKYIFSRFADEVGVYTDSACSKIVTVDDTSFLYSKTINAGIREHFYVSAIMNLSDTTLNGGKIIVNSDPAYRAIAHEDIYITVDSAFSNILGTAKSATNREYYDFEADTPNVTLGNSVGYPMQIHGCESKNNNESKYSLTVTVQNMAKPLESLSILNVDSDSLNFINKNGAIDNNWHTKSFRVKAAYGTGSGTYNYYEPFKLTIPDCFDYEVVDAEGKTVTVTNDNTVNPSGNPDAQAKEFTYTVVLTLKTTATAMSDGKIFAIGTDTSEAQKKSNEVGVTVGVGLSEVKFTVDNQQISAGNATPVSVGLNFENNKAGNKKTIEIPLEFVTLGTEYGGYNSVEYDMTNLSVVFNGASANMNADKSAFIISLLASTASGDYEFTATFIDTAFGASKAFTVNLSIVVTHDVYSISQNTYDVRTNGGEGLTAYQNVVVSYNDGNTNYAPELDSSKLNVKLVLRSGNSEAYTYTDYNVANTVKKDTDGWWFAVPQSLHSGDINGKQLCVLASYGGNVSYAEVHITTTAVGIGYAEGITVDDNTASVKITSAAENTFKLAAKVYTLGTNETKTDAVISYALYSDPARTSVITTGVTIGTDGVITFTNPPAYSGTVYYRASYDGKNYDVAISYTVDIASVEFVGISSDVLSGNNITMYCVDSTHNTTLDLADHIKVNSVLSGMSDTSGATLSVKSSAPTIVSVSEKELSSVISGTSTVTISATYNGKTVTNDYAVTVVGLSVSLDKESGTIDINVGNGSVEFTPTVRSTVNGKTLSYTLTAKYETDKFNLDNGTTKIVSLNDKSAFKANEYKAYELIGTYTFNLPEGSSLNSANGLFINRTFMLTVTNNFKFDSFELKDGSDTITVGGSVSAVAGKTYTIQIPNYVKDADHKYSVGTSNAEIATATLNETNGLITVTPIRTAFGSVKITVTVTAYNKSVSCEQSYTFASNVTVTTTMSTDLSGVTFTGEADKTKTVQIDYTTAAPTFTYTLAVGNPTVTADNVDNVRFTWSGDVERTSYSSDGLSVTFTVSKPTTLTVIGYVEVDGRRYYGDEYTLTLAATEPKFTLDATKTEIKPNETAAFSVSLPVDTQFKGEYTVSYAFVGTVGSDVATIANNTSAKTATVTPNLQRTDDRAVVVRATVTVDNGAFKDKTYVLEKSLTIKGVPLPTISATQASVTFTWGTEYDLSNFFKVTLGTDRELTFDVGKAPNHSYGGGKITLTENAETSKAGYIFDIAATVKVKDGYANAGKSDTATLTVYVNPTVTESGKTIAEGRKGSYNIKDAVTIAMGTADDSFKSTDDYIVDYTLSGADSSVFVDGSTLTLNDNVTGSDKTVTLSAKVTITSGEHAGAEISVGSVTVTVQPVPQYTVTFDSGIQSQTVLEGDKAIRPADPDAPAGHTFKEWRVGSTTGGKYNFAAPVTANVSLVAYFEKNVYTVSFDSVGGSDVANASIDYGEKVSRPVAPTKTGYTFDGWYTNAAYMQAYDFDTLVTSSFTLYAKWNANTYTVTFNSDGGTSIADATVNFGDKIVRPADPTKEGHTFGGWYNGGVSYDFATVVNTEGNITLVAQWTINQYTVTFNYDCASITNTSTKANYNATVTKPTDPTRNDGYTFDKWYLNGAEYNFATTVTSDITLVAKWTVKTFAVTFTYQDENSDSVTYATQTVVYGGKVIEPKAPTKTGYTFKEWKLNGAAYDFATTVTEAITLVADWEADPVYYTVKFMDDETEYTQFTQTVLNDSNIIEPKDPTKADHTFGGWYKNAECSEDQKFDFENDTVQSNLTLYAKWTETPPTPEVP